MANEHTLLTQKTLPVSRTCANGTGIEKGSVLKSTDPSTVIITSASYDPVAGILYTEKVANDGQQAAVLTGPGDELRGIASGSIGQGDPLMTADAAFPNYLVSVKSKNALEISGGSIIGDSLEVATAGQTFKYVLNIRSVPGDIA